MSLQLASIASGAWAGSTNVRVQCSDANGTVILLHQGNLLLGSGPLAGGFCTIITPALAEGEIIQASVTQKGNRCGNPVRVAPLPVRVSGWKSPTEVLVTQNDGTLITLSVDQFRALYNYAPVSVYDPEGTGAFLPPEYENEPPVPLGFQLDIVQPYGSTSVTVRDITGLQGSALIRFNGGAYSNNPTATFTAAQTVTIDVQDSLTGRVASRSVAVTIVPPPAQPSSQIRGYLYRLSRSVNVVSILANCIPQLQCRIVGFDNDTWRTMNYHDTDYQQSDIGPLPNGSYTYQIRVAGDNNSANWVSVPFTY